GFHVQRMPEQTANPNVVDRGILRHTLNLSSRRESAAQTAPYASPDCEYGRTKKVRRPAVLFWRFGQNRRRAITMGVFLKENLRQPFIANVPFAQRARDHHMAARGWAGIRFRRL